MAWRALVPAPVPAPVLVHQYRCLYRYPWCLSIDEAPFEDSKLERKRYLAAVRPTCPHWSTDGAGHALTQLGTTEAAGKKFDKKGFGLRKCRQECQNLTAYFAGNCVPPRQCTVVSAWSVL